MNTGVNYKLFYEILLNLREAFHSYGRIDDSNTKLDEIVKLIMLSYYHAIKGEKFCLSFVKNYAYHNYSDSSLVAPALRDLFDKAVQYDLYKNIDGTSILGTNATLNIQPSENLFAERLISEIEKIDFLNLISEDHQGDFDIINECFGHFVRENFRNNKEDAQYMTPAEIAMPILKMVFNDFVVEGYFDKCNLAEFRIMDPTCGVGTLLIESARKFIDQINQINEPAVNKEKIINQFLLNGVLGQDKVDRMVRLSKINTLLMGANCNNICIGNSISETSSIDNWHEKIDFIFTNPPFGAEYNYLSLNKEHYAFLECLNCENQNLPSELLILLKCLSLLKPCGKLAIVLPDSVFSARGLNEPIRKIITKHFTINAIIAMPAVTFAQAGTRTKTSVLYLTKNPPVPKAKIVMGICEDIGYIVKERMGVPVKIQSGNNQTDEIANAYINADFSQTIISSEPSVSTVSVSRLIDGILNPSFYSASRLQTLTELENKNMEGFELRSLKEIVHFETIGRKNKGTSNNTKHISVLHINPDCTIDFQQVMHYNPISKGRQCFMGDILFSKINPRIPRITVVPAFEKDLVCSNEFEILQPCSDLDAFSICFLLKTSYVTKQIENLTSGTSSSHSRIKRAQLAEIKIPYPVSATAKSKMSTINTAIKQSFERKYAANQVLREQLEYLESI